MSNWHPVTAGSAGGPATVVLVIPPDPGDDQVAGGAADFGGWTFEQYQTGIPPSAQYPSLEMERGTGAVEQHLAAGCAAGCSPQPAAPAQGAPPWPVSKATLAGLGS